MHDELTAGVRLGVVVALAVMAVMVPTGPTEPPGSAAGVTVVARQTPPGGPSAEGLRPAPDAGLPRDARADLRWLVGRIGATGDHAGTPFVIVDKIAARLYLFDAQVRLRGDAPVLIGSAVGDDSPPGIGERAIIDITPAERITPAGRFLAQRGRNDRAETVVWLDYASALSMHRVRTHNPAEARLSRLQSATVDDNRISYGCINTPAEFFDQHIWPLITRQRVPVYVLPETRTVQAAFPALAEGTLAVAASR